MNDEAYRDDPSIPDDAIVWRRVPPSQTGIEDGARRPTSGAFDDSSSDGSPMSVVIDRQGRQPSAIVEKYPSVGVVSLRVGDLRGLEFAVCYWHDDDDADHAYVVGKKTHSKKKRMKNACTWLVHPEG